MVSPVPFFAFYDSFFNLYGFFGFYRFFGSSDPFN